METRERRIDRLEDELERQGSALEELQRSSVEGDSRPGPWLQRVGVLAEKAVVPVVVLVLGFALKDSVDQALRRRQLELSAASEIRGLVERLASSDREEARAAAVTLASFGDFAAVALARELQEAGTVGALAAEDGLRSLALSGSAEACDVLRRMVRNRTRLYDWRTHRRAVRLLGELGCEEARGDLERLRRLVEEREGGPASETYGALVRGEVDPDDLRQLRETLDEALENLDRARG